MEKQKQKQLRLLFYAQELFPIYQFMLDGNQILVDLEDNDQQLSVDPCQQHTKKSHQWTADDSAKRRTKAVRLEGSDDTTEKHHDTTKNSHGEA